MKLKLLALAVSGVILAGCNNDTNIKPNVAVQAWDPAVYQMNAAADCTDGTTETGKTDFSGNAAFYSSTIVNSPETCSFTFTGDANSVDVSNGKSMDGVTYVLPKGLAAAGAPITASPLTTLINTELKTTGAEYSDSAAQTILVDLGLTDILTSGVSINELLTNTETVTAKLKADGSDNYNLLSATTAVLSDVIKQDPTAEASDVATTAKAFTEQVLVAESDYPETSTGELVVVELDPSEIDDVISDVEGGDNSPTVPPQNDKLEPAKPVDPPKPPTGGTGGGGTGGTGGEG